MYYYKIEIPFLESCEEAEKCERRGRSGRSRSRRYESLFDTEKQAIRMTKELEGTRALFHSYSEGNVATFGLISPGLVDTDMIDSVARDCGSLLREGEMGGASVAFREVSFRDICLLLQESDDNDLIFSKNRVLAELELDELDDIYDRRWNRKSSWFFESLIDDSDSPDEIVAQARGLKSQSLLDELGRIQSARDSVRGFVGHPVHYVINSSVRGFADKAAQLLLEALHGAERLQSRRVTHMNLAQIDPEYWNAALGGSRGGVLCASIERPQDNDDGLIFVINHRSFDLDKTLVLLNEAMQKMKGDTLLVLSFDMDDPELMEMVEKAMTQGGEATLPFVKINPDYLDEDRAREYVAYRLDEHETAGNVIPLRARDGKRPLYVAELDAMIDGVVESRKMSSFDCVYGGKTFGFDEGKHNNETSALEELDALIGLEGAKGVIGEFLSFSKARTALAGLGRSDDSMAMHMAFTGNPGTAKTTVARLVARILKEEGVLEKGHIVEVGRGDLVGKYVGHTAPMVKGAFNRARGGVLFIDEAYSLVDDKHGLYGDEAINTIVQEMENMREEVVVIFAGYPEEMEAFIERNPGLRSRISHHVDFPDYSAEELVAIATKIARDKGFILSSGAKSRIGSVMKDATAQDDFGNGRFARNVIEKAVARQGQRLLSSDVSKLTKRSACTIVKDDIELPAKPKREEVKFGFAA